MKIILEKKAKHKTILMRQTKITFGFGIIITTTISSFKLLELLLYDFNVIARKRNKNIFFDIVCFLIC